MTRIFCKCTFLFFFIVSTHSFSQDLKAISKLPTIINESSGIESSGVNRLWTFNDSGGKPELYLIDTIGNLLKILKITNALNRDWEDITKDAEGNFYIGNIGNNNNSTKDLTVFKISNPNNIKGDSTTAEVISFSFEDQTSFPPSKKEMNFDCEALIWYKQYLYVFTKQRSFPTATNLYRFPAIKGNHIAKKIGTFYTGKKKGKATNFGSHWVTAAAISPDGTKVALVNSKKLWVFYDFKEDNFFDGKFIEVSLGDKTKKEAVCFATNNKLYITDEYWAHNNIGGNLYTINLIAFIDN